MNLASRKTFSYFYLAFLLQLCNPFHATVESGNDLFLSFDAVCLISPMCEICSELTNVSTVDFKETSVQKTSRGVLMFSGGIEIDQWHEMG